MGWDLGPPGSPLWPGFSALEPSHPMLKGRYLKGIDRGVRQQAVEGLTSDGIRGIEQLTLPLPPGRWYLTLWLRDPGEWEYLPHPLQRAIYHGSELLWQERTTAERWIEKVYLKGREQELSLSDTSWSRFGERPEGRVSVAVKVEGETGLILDIQGDQPEAGFIAAILAEKNPAYPARQQVEAERAQWWLNNWPSRGWPPAVEQPNKTEPRLEPLPDNRSRVAPNTATSLGFQFYSDNPNEPLQVDIEPPRLDDISLPVELRWGAWQLRRTGMASTLLIPTQRYLRSGSPPPPPAPHAPRLLDLRSYIPPAIPAGLYRGNLKLTQGEHQLRVPITLEVLNVKLPELDRPVGIYHERPVHFGWFAKTRPLAEQAMVCDLLFLRRQGLTGIAPPLSTPATAAEQQQFIEEIQTTVNAGFMPPFLAYSPLKRLIARLGMEQALATVHKVEERLKQEGLPAPVWASADEPSNPSQVNHPARIRAYAGAFAPDAKLAG